MIETIFKETELGPIPEDWEFGKFADFLNTFSAGATPFRGISSYFVGNIPWITSGELNFNRITDTIEHISLEGQKKTHLTIYPKGTFLIAITGLEAAGTRGRCAFVETPATTNQSCLAITSSDKMHVNYLFWFYRLWSDYLAFNFSQGPKQQSFTADIAKKLPIYRPPLTEQLRIAEALSDIDTLIAEMEALIEKKRAIMTATMQNLLTARRRLTGYSEPWKEYQFSSFGSTFNGLSGKSANDFGHGDAYYVTFVNVIYNTVIDKSILQRVDVRKNEKQNSVIKGDLLLNTSSETPEEVGMCSFVSELIPDLYLNSFCFGFRIFNDEIDPLFLSFLIRSAIGRKLMIELAQGSTRYNLPKKKFLNSSILLPNKLSEQRAIATILSDMDAELAELETKRDKYIAIRQGMMQQLLTGKIRLI